MRGPRECGSDGGVKFVDVRSGEDAAPASKTRRMVGSKGGESSGFVGEKSNGTKGMGWAGRPKGTRFA